MKTKTLLELLTLSSSLYYIVKDTQLLDRFNEISEKGLFIELKSFNSHIFSFSEAESNQTLH